MRALFAGAALAAGAAYAVPEATVSEIVQKVDGAVEVSYVLSGAPAIMWMDVQTNGPSGFASIGAEAIYGDGFTKGALTGDANVVVREDGAKLIRWKPSRTWRNHQVPSGDLRFVLRAYAADNAPSYMGVDLLTGEVRYFPTANDVPGGVKALGWRTTRMLFRRIQAHGVTWMSGNPFFSSSVGNQAPIVRPFAFPNDFFVAVFETTQKQWKTLCGEAVVPYVSGDRVPAGVNADLLPMERASFRHIRETDATVASAGAENETYMYPNPPCPTSFLGRLRALTKSAAFPSGIDFDLPGESHWEYVCRAGHDTEHWGNGEWAETGGATSSAPGRCLNSPECAGTAAPAECGSYAPNAWGIYDMHGNVFELCLDWFANSPALTGDWLVNADGKKLVSDPTTTISRRVRRGGWYGIDDTYAVGHYRVQSSQTNERLQTFQTPDTLDARCGFRVFCRAGLW